MSTAETCAGSESRRHRVRTFFIKIKSYWPNSIIVKKCIAHTCTLQ
ncbi:hypothetical protein EDWATA_03264 [Edwardsiella tarda ATCC 23685]|uniref:Uncharacterized protein n=1 Tax=Edwardsiella tarda ATCC 23685 TaxID=500638 RepID=D4F909_EDWTA|nr:hypothetical protein EDWATA_03264 [Edwardsiella tarda ATCC 23685]